MEISTRFRTPRGTSNSIFGRSKTRAQEDGTASDAEPRSKHKERTDNPETSNNAAFKKPGIPASATRTNDDNRVLSMQRKGSIVRGESRTLHGPRPLQDIGKRIFSEGLRNPIMVPRGQTLPSSSSMPLLNSSRTDSKSSGSTTSSIRVEGRLDSRYLDPLPTVNFDDFQSDIAKYDIQTETSPETSADSYMGSADRRPDGISIVRRGSDMDLMQTTPLQSSFKENRPDNNRELSRISSFQSNATTEASGNFDAATPTSESSTAEWSRKLTSILSQNRTAASPTATQPPRNTGSSILLPKTSRYQRGPSDQPLSGGSMGQNSRAELLQRRRTLIATGATADLSYEQSKISSPTRATKVKSMQPPPRQQGLRLQTESESYPDQHRLPSANTWSDLTPIGTSSDICTPVSATTQQRLSGRLSGLGARTISPTDARRLKRASMMPSQTPAAKSMAFSVKPEPMPMPMPMPMPDWRSTARSPSMIPRKASVTPSSVRGTPDSSTQYYLSATSLSRSSSHQSLRAAGTTSMPRMTQSPSLSRLPMPRGRNVYSSAEIQTEEMVPPVPAIPKAYESPHELGDTPFFSNTSAFSSHPTSAISQTSNRSNGGGVELPLDMQIPSSLGFLYDSLDPLTLRRSQPADGRIIDEPKSAAPFTPAPKKKMMQSARLPPLSLQPLSSPTAAKIAALPQPSVEVDNRRTSPPVQRNTTRTPNTPMTASKATFHNKRTDFGSRPLFGMRSNSSYHLAPNPNDQTMSMPGAFPVMDSHETSAQNGNLLDRGANSEQRNSTTSRSRAQASNNSSKEHIPEPNSAAGVDDNDRPRTTTPGRRKFSISWMRSSSKSANITTNRPVDQPESSYPNPPSMPQLNIPDAIEIQSRKLSTGSLVTAVELERHQSDQFDRTSPPMGQSHVTESSTDLNSTHPQSLRSGPTDSPSGRAASWSVNPQRRSSSRPSLVPAQSALDVRSDSVQQELRPNKDDQMADDEMARLASKRKEVEAAAKVTDELLKRVSCRPRMTPAEAIQGSAGLLNIYEKGEIIDYKGGVYFCGTRTAKKHVGNIAAASTTNFGYDDERGDYNICIGDHLAYRYEVVDILGKGSFGQVLRCVDHKDGRLVAVKIIRNKKRFHQQALVEVNILKKLSEWDPVGSHGTLTITSSFYFRQHLCIVTPCLSNNLYELIREHNFSGFSLNIIRRFARQMLKCLQLLQSKSIIHCDLKPENILLCDPRRAEIRVIDFGSSCRTDEKVYTYIQSRFYRSPEVILGSEYGLGIDMWSFGCILAELYTGYPIFPGENEQEQLACIMEIFGPPSREIIEKCSRRKLFFDSSWKPRVTVSSKGRRRRPSSKSLQTALKCDNEAFLDFITQCLRWDPDKRLRADQAVNHAFITNEPFRKQTERVARARMINMQNKSLVNVTGSISPSKRSVPLSASAMTISRTPAKDAKDAKARPLPQTPSTVLRNGTANIRPLDSIAAPGTNHVSPVKSSVPANRRLSSLVTSASLSSLDGSTSQSGGRRASNGMLGGGVGSSFTPSTSSSSSLVSLVNSGLPRMSRGRIVSAESINAGDSGMMNMTLGTKNTVELSAIDLASAAARESMGIGAASSRWR